MPRRLKILLSAYFCSPYKGSESGLGWNVASRLAAHHDVTVLCGDFHSSHPTLKDLERYRAEHGLPDGLSIEHVPGDVIVRFWNRVHRLPGLWFCYYIAYRRWQKLGLRRAKTLHASEPFDLAHHLNIIGFREPGELWSLGIPFLWGPVSGAPLVPKEFLVDFSAGQRFRWAVRNILNVRQRKGGARCRRTAARAHRIWAVSMEDREMIASWGYPSKPLLETGGVLPLKTAVPVVWLPGEPLRLVWSGLFLGIKALPLLLRAIARLDRRDEIVLDVLGDGPEKPRWLDEVRALGLETQVSFRGLLPKEDALAAMRGAHVLVHTSVKEGTPHVVLEALSNGLPVICHDACGMGIAVTSECGIKVPLESPEASIEGFQAAIGTILSDRALLRRMSKRALARARDLSWDSMIANLEAGYRLATDTGPRRST